jgi:hypothetical protein
MAGNDTYYIFMQDHFERHTLREIAQYRREQGKTIWSARLGTGLFGRTNCEAGNKGPKGETEVLLAAGDEGLVKLVELGFITCPVCRPEDVEGFWETAQYAVMSNYGLRSVNEFTDKTILEYDARRVSWEDIVQMTGAMPGRLYLPKGLDIRIVENMRRWCDRRKIKRPSMGYYDTDAPGMFVEY